MNSYCYTQHSGKKMVIDAHDLDEAISAFRILNDSVVDGRVEMVEQSAKHICFALTADRERVIEFYVIGQDVHRAPIDTPISTNGSRIGRFEYPNTKQYLRFLESVWKISFANKWEVK